MKIELQIPDTFKQVLQTSFGERWGNAEFRALTHSIIEKHRVAAADELQKVFAEFYIMSQYDPSTDSKVVVTLHMPDPLS